MLQRREYFPPRSFVSIQNETYSIHDNKTPNTFDVSPRRDSDVRHYFISGIYKACNEFEAALKDDSLSYHRKTEVMGHETHVIKFDNPQRPENASWYESMFWLDTKTGALVKTTYRLLLERSLEELKTGR